VVVLGTDVLLLLYNAIGFSSFGSNLVAGIIILVIADKVDKFHT
jgi:hypothetical protein